MPVVKWRFDDLVTSESYVFDVNPNAGGDPQYKKTIVQQNTVAPNGKTILSEGADAPLTLSWNGTIVDIAQHQVFITWWTKRYQVQLTDDLGRVFMIYIQNYAPTRARSATRAYKNTYQIDAVVVSWTGED